MPDYHALITEMADELDHNRQCLLDDRRLTHPLADRARAALAEADGPAVPDGREPASVVGEPSDEELEALAGEHSWDDPNDWIDYIAFARAVLARYGHQPAPPVEGADCPACEGVPKPGNQPCAVCGRSALSAEGEVAELAWWLRSLEDASVWFESGSPEALKLTRAADLLEQCHPTPVPVAALSSDYREPWDMSSEDGSQCFASAIMSRLVGVDAADEADARWLAAYLQANSRPQHFQPAPVPVSERLPGDALSWWYEPDEDDDGSGYGGNWTLLRIRGGVSYYTHWLPANALPLPAPEGGEDQP